MKRLFFLLTVASLFATVNEPLRLEIFSGYRNDRIHWHLQKSGLPGQIPSGELYRDVQYWLNGILFKVIHRDLVFLIRGAYGTFGRGTLVQPRSSTDGWCADASGYFGYAVNLTPDRTYKFIFTPLVGYAGYFEKLHTKLLPDTFGLVWNGFFVGGGIGLQTGGPMTLNLGWAYNMMHNRVHARLHSVFLRTSSGGNKGQLGWAQMDWNFDSFWRVGLGVQMLYLTTRVVDATLGDTQQNFKLRWTPVSGWLQISRTL